MFEQHQRSRKGNVLSSYLFNTPFGLPGGLLPFYCFIKVFKAVTAIIPPLSFLLALNSCNLSKNFWSILSRFAPSPCKKKTSDRQYGKECCVTAQKTRDITRSLFISIKQPLRPSHWGGKMSSASQAVLSLLFCSLREHPLFSVRDSKKFEKVYAKYKNINIPDSRAEFK